MIRSTKKGRIGKGRSSYYSVIQIEVERLIFNPSIRNWVIVVHDRSLSASSEIAIYIDGNLKLLTTMYGLNGNVSGNFGSYPLFIGQRNGSSLGFVCQLKNLKIYNYPIL